MCSWLETSTEFVVLYLQIQSNLPILQLLVERRALAVPSSGPLRDPVQLPRPYGGQHLVASVAVLLYTHHALFAYVSVTGRMYTAPASRRIMAHVLCLGCSRKDMYSCTSKLALSACTSVVMTIGWLQNMMLMTALIHTSATVTCCLPGSHQQGH